ncbi:MAG: peptidase M4 [Candidatus Competibacteraceae bacterium]|nr:peptidase M4 [Candidatus Competibacteraceae bacterium]HRY15325.1 peptidase M4 [Candidatus Competibacteraceae bacterium]
MRALLAGTAVLWFALCLSGPAIAGRDHDEIRRLRNAGQILSLEVIIANHRRQYRDGQLLEAELELEEGRYVYDLKFLGDDGVVREFEYDARTGELWHIEHGEEDH